jgi:hydrogenase nickel incorporation protein HypA/HybF
VHEMSIAMEVMKIVGEHLPADNNSRVVRIKLKVGKLTALSADSFKFCMEVITKDTPAEGAAVEIEEVPLVVKCLDCGKESKLDEPLFVCPGCGSGMVDIVSGRDLFIESIEVTDNTEGVV